MDKGWFQESSIQNPVSSDQYPLSFSFTATQDDGDDAIEVGVRLDCDRREANTAVE